MLQTRYYNVGGREQGKYLVQTRSQAKSRCIISPQVHGIDKGKDQYIRPEKQVIKLVETPETKSIIQYKPRIGQGRAGKNEKKHLISCILTAW